MTPLMVFPGRLVVAVLCGSLLALAPAAAQNHKPAEQSAAPDDQDATADDSILSMLTHDLRTAAEREREREAAAEKLRAEQAAAELETKTSSQVTPEAIAMTSLFARPLVIPVKGLQISNLDDNYGTKRDGGRRRHKGIDIFAPRGTEAVAVCDGYIESIGRERLGGNTVRIRGNDGRQFYYAHLDRYEPGIYDGMVVKQGDVIGYIGNTGNARRSSPHLHFAVTEGNNVINPYPLLLNRETSTTLAGGFGASGQ
jgi:murein DD-endopeptidase MepM/ murein hydrolase activator NlpD